MIRRTRVFLAILLLFIGAIIYANTNINYDVLGNTFGGDSAAESICVFGSGTKQKKGDKDSVVVLIQADSAKVVEIMGHPYRKVIGNATFLHNNTYLKCDSALWDVDGNKISAFGDVQVIQENTFLTGDQIEYYTNQSLAVVSGKVVELFDKQGNKLRTDEIVYNTKDSIGYFSTGGVLKSSDGDIMESESGVYLGKEKKFSFKDKVQVFVDSTFISSKEIDYLTEPKLVLFGSSTVGWNDENMLTADDGSYDRGREFFTLRRNGYMFAKEHEVWGDIIEYDKFNERVEINDNAQIYDTINRVFLLGDLAIYENKPNTNAFLTKSPAMLLCSNDGGVSDTLFIRADTIKYYNKPMYMVDSMEVIASKERAKLIKIDPLVEIDKKASLMDPNKKRDLSPKPPRPGYGGTMAQADGLSGTGGAGVAGGVGAGVAGVGDAGAGAAGGGVGVVSGDSGVVQKDTIQNNSIDQLNVDLMEILEKLKDTLNSAAVRDSLMNLFIVKDSLMKSIMPAVMPADTMSGNVMPMDTLHSGAVMPKDTLQNSYAVAQDTLRSTVMPDTLKSSVSVEKNMVQNSTVMPGDTLHSGAVILKDTLQNSYVVSKDTLQSSDVAIDSLSSNQSLSNMANQLLDTALVTFVEAYHDIKMFRKDMQAVADSVIYTSLDSLARFYKKPIMWNNEKNQITADSMQLLIIDNALKKADFLSNSFIAAYEDSVFYNQIKSTEMISYFNSEEMYRFDALGGVSSIFYLQEDSIYTSINMEDCKLLTARFKNQEVQRIRAIDDVKSDVKPLFGIPLEEQRLRGFEWLDSLRPKSKSEVTNRVVKGSERERLMAVPFPNYEYTGIYFKEEREMIFAYKRYVDSVIVERRLQKNRKKEDLLSDSTVVDTVSVESVDSIKVADNKVTDTLKTVATDTTVNMQSVGDTTSNIISCVEDSVAQKYPVLTDDKLSTMSKKEIRRYNRKRNRYIKALQKEERRKQKALARKKRKEERSARKRQKRL